VQDGSHVTGRPGSNIVRTKDRLRGTIGLPGSKSADRCRSSEAADAAAAAQPTAAADKGFPRLVTLLA
jgi:hypothetical protein